MRYDHKNIEAKWQKYWDQNKTFKVEVDLTKPKFYVLDMFPYASGAGLHVGHVLGYTATDIIARYKRQKGYNVLHPMGWDSFGLPAEQYAVRTGTHPAVITEKNTNHFRKQLKSLGFSYDWDREFSTHEADYYKWTQWIFTKLYEKGLAYQAQAPVNWCPALGTVLANEEVENGLSKEGGHPVERRPFRQWILKITAYAERLLQDLDLVDWPEHLKRLQKNWIGKSTGVEVIFPVSESKEKIAVFTTRPDTLFGATYLVLAPEHPLVEAIFSEENRNEVIKYQKIAAAKSELDRTDLNKEKRGVFVGSYAVNPANGQKIPIWISDYVLMSYGTGAVMAVPAHDERDFQFAKMYHLPIVSVFEPDTEMDPDLIPIGVAAEEIKEAVMDGKLCWTKEGKCIRSANTEVSLNGLSVKQAIETITAWLESKKLGKKAVNYKLRDWLFSRQRYWGEPFPVLHFEDGSVRCLQLDELPLTPPALSDFKPHGDGRSPLARASDWVNIIDMKTGKSAYRETNTMPQWAGSCWYYLRFCDPQNEERAWQEKKEKYWMPVDIYVGGVEHAVLHLLYARFWHKVLFDLGYVSTCEPFQTLRNQGLIVARSFKNQQNKYVSPSEVVEKNGRFFLKTTGEELNSQFEKMSKSKLNGVSPDDIIAEFGADSLRLYEMFMGPLDKEKIWNTSAVSGCRRFLTRYYAIVQSGKITTENDENANQLGHKLVNSVEKDIETMQFNTAIAKMMEFMNQLIKLDRYPKNVLKMLTQVLMPFAPHIAEEGWELLGFQESLTTHPWPRVDPKYLMEEQVTYIIQINGRVRGRFRMPKGLSQEEILVLAKKEPNICRHIEKKTIRKVIFVPDKVLNLVV